MTPHEGHPVGAVGVETCTIRCIEPLAGKARRGLEQHCLRRSRQSRVAAPITCWGWGGDRWWI